MSGETTQLKISRCKVSDGEITVEDDVSFKAMINPAEFKHRKAISYAKSMVLGQPASDARFSGFNEELLDFSLWLDGTGAVPRGANEPLKSVPTLLGELTNVIYKYEGNKHEPSRVQVLWGSKIFFGRLKSMNTQYTLFKSSGVPLRAKVDLGFVSFKTSKAAKLEANLSSPDLTHTVLVREGDTLPLLCQRIYGDPGYVQEVARINQLSSFRVLAPGTRLNFPPLE